MLFIVSSCFCAGIPLKGTLGKGVNCKFFEKDLPRRYPQRKLVATGGIEPPTLGL